MTFGLDGTMPSIVTLHNACKQSGRSSEKAGRNTLHTTSVYAPPTSPIHMPANMLHMNGDVRTDHRASEQERQAFEYTACIE